MTFIRNVIVLAVGVLLAAWIVPGIDYKDWRALALVVCVLALFNAIVKPILVLFTLPFIFLSLGVGLWLINALMLYWASKLVDGFIVTNFWRALWGALVISVVSMLLSGSGRVRKSRSPRNGPPPPPTPPPADSNGGGEIIDV